MGVNYLAVAKSEDFVAKGPFIFATCGKSNKKRGYFEQKYRVFSLKKGGIFHTETPFGRNFMRSGGFKIGKGGKNQWINE